MSAWWELRLIGLPRPQLDRLSARLFDLGASGLQEDWLPGTEPPPRQPWDEGPEPALPDRMVLRAWFDDPDRERIGTALAQVEAELLWAPVEEMDWEAAWRASFSPIRVSPRIVVAPPWDAPAGSVIIEPGLGFGSGAHPSTQMALADLDAVADECRTALDVGCGSGVLAIAAARLGLEVQGIDIDEPSVRDSRANAERNQVEGNFSTTPAHGLHGTWDLVLGNLHAELIEALAPELLRLTGRWLVLAGIMAEKEDRVLRCIGTELELEHRRADDAWVGLRFRRPQ